jgi:hypothetical protein
MILKKSLLISILALLVLVGCQGTSNNDVLDTSKLKKVEMQDVSKKQQKNMPITYEATTLKDGLDALPFEMTLPKELPFDAKSFQPPVINDMAHDGKKLMVEVRTFSKNKDENIVLMVKASYPVSDSQMPNAEEVKLKNDVVGKYLGNTVSFQLNDTSYDVVYVNKNIPLEQHKEEIIKMANQMIN